MFACGGMVLVWFGTVCGVRYGGRKGNGERRHVHALRWLRKLRLVGIVCCYGKGGEKTKKRDHFTQRQAGRRGSVVFI